MAKIKKPPSKSQAVISADASLKARDRDLGSSLKAEERAIKAAARARDSRLKADQREFDKALKLIEGKGLYTPKSHELTRYRKSRVRKIQKEFGEFLNLKEYFFIPANEAKRAAILERANSLSMKTTKRGIFFEKQGHKSASLKEDKKRGEFYIERTGKVKRGERAGKKYRSVTPLASIDALDRERGRLAEMAEALGPLGKNERLYFRVTENGHEGYSHNVFSEISDLLAYLDSYKKKTPARVNFYRHIEIQKVHSSAAYFKDHKPRAAKRSQRKVNAKGRNV